MTPETERLLLRPWRPEDAPVLFRLARDPEVGPAAGWPPHTSVEHSLQIIREVLCAEGTFAIVLKATGQPIGSIGIMLGANLPTAPDEAELGFWLGRDYWGQGLIPEAAEKCLEHCFKTLHLRRVLCGYYRGNEKSRRAQEKCGFHHIATRPNIPCPLLGDTRTEEVQAITREEWEERRS